VRAVLGAVAPRGAGFLVAARSEAGTVTDHWCEAVRRRIRADEVIVICGEHTDDSVRMSSELRVAQEERKPYSCSVGPPRADVHHAGANPAGWMHVQLDLGNPVATDFGHSPKRAATRGSGSIQAALIWGSRLGVGSAFGRARHQMATCLLWTSNKFCGAPGRTPSGIPLRCTRDPGHAGEHVACGEEANEHPIFRWTQQRQYKRKRSR
jgi:hypothetical protein